MTCCFVDFVSCISDFVNPVLPCQSLLVIVYCASHMHSAFTVYAMASITATKANMSFCTLPAEIRVRVYKYLWQGTWVRLNDPTIHSDMWEHELELWDYSGATGNEYFMSALLQSCRQIHCEALAIYHDLVELHIPRYTRAHCYDVAEMVQSYIQCAENIDRQDNYQAPFKGFRNITIPTLHEVENLPIIARQCPDMRRLTFFEDDTREFGHTWVPNPLGVPIETIVASKKHQMELFSTVHDAGDACVWAGLELLKRKSTLQRTKRFEHMKHVKIFLKHEFEVENWDDDNEERRYDVVSHVDPARCFVQY